ncbi:LysM peptidoglycan-binding domain-containing protein [Paeniglutamicibacter sp. ZC-3]|nr:LysM domain-containing protein [Paeniglutamicibacter sp. ZC-3]MCV9993086.1 LysM peptidoglycan-binding domain-containing protein [Paeniglutamicibacter sp. ZC-3]
MKKSSESSYKTSSTKSYKTKSVPAKSYASSGKRAAAPVAKAPAISVNVKDSGENYTVKAGDTMFKIAQSQGLSSWQDLHALNQDVAPSADLIFVGQSLDLPTK